MSNIPELYTTRGEVLCQAFSKNVPNKFLERSELYAFATQHKSIVICVTDKYCQVHDFPSTSWSMFLISSLPANPKCLYLFFKPYWFITKISYSWARCIATPSTKANVIKKYLYLENSMLDINHFSSNQAYYSRGVAHGDIKNATKENPTRITRYEFVTRQFDAYLDQEGRYCENLVAEHPHSENVCAS